MDAWLSPHHERIIAWFGIIALVTLFFALLELLGLVLGHLTHTAGSVTDAAASGRSVAAVLRARYIDGEIGADEYQAARETIEHQT